MIRRRGIALAHPPRPCWHHPLASARRRSWSLDVVLGAERVQRAESDLEDQQSFQHGRGKTPSLREVHRLAQGHKLGGGTERGQVASAPEFFPGPPLWPASQRGRFRCVRMGVNDHQQSSRQPLRCFYNGILIRSPHHPAELKSAPVCLFLVRLLLPTGNRRQRLWPTYLRGPPHSRGQTPSSGPQRSCKCHRRPCSRRGEGNAKCPFGTGKGAGRSLGTLPCRPGRRPSPLSMGCGVRGNPIPSPTHPSRSCIRRHRHHPPGRSSGQKPERSLPSLPSLGPPPILSKSCGLQPALPGESVPLTTCQAGCRFL